MKVYVYTVIMYKNPCALLRWGHDDRKTVEPSRGYVQRFTVKKFPLLLEYVYTVLGRFEYWCCGGPPGWPTLTICQIIYVRILKNGNMNWLMLCGTVLTKCQVWHWQLSKKQLCKCNLKLLSQFISSQTNLSFTTPKCTGHVAVQGF